MVLLQMACRARRDLWCRVVTALSANLAGFQVNSAALALVQAALKVSPALENARLDLIGAFVLRHVGKTVRLLVMVCFPLNQ